LPAAIFTNVTKTANFNSAQVGSVLNLQRVFDGGADFTLLNAGIQVWADDAQFTNPIKMSHSTADGSRSALFRKTIFAGGGFYRANIDGDLILTEAEFTNGAKQRNITVLKSVESRPSERGLRRRPTSQI
jgi:hypothetical protein